jgi:hypothetical protein
MPRPRNLIDWLIVLTIAVVVVCILIPPKWLSQRQPEQFPEKTIRIAVPCGGLDAPKADP